MPDRAPATNAAAAGNAGHSTGGSAAHDSEVHVLTEAFRPWHEYFYGRFYKYARGHILNRYNVSLQGPYVEEALRVMDLNTTIDRNTKAKKLSHGKFPFKREAFKAWLDLHYDSKNHLLNMLWVSQDVNIQSASASSGQYNIDTVKNDMPYPVLTKYAGPKTLTLTVIDDPYFMWYQFFNALFNVQFSTRVLKVRSTFQKILVCVDVYGEMTTAIGPAKDELQHTNKTYFTTDDLAQSYEFNSCVMENAPAMGKLQSQESGSFYTFSVAFKFPNAFQGTSKCELRGLRDNTIEGSVGVGINGIDSDSGEFRREFFEESRPNRKNNINTSDETSSLNAISHQYYDKSFTDRQLPKFSTLPDSLKTYPELPPDAEPKKNNAPKSDSKNPQADYMAMAQNLFPVDDWQNLSPPASYTPTKVPVSDASAADWAGIPYK